MVRIELDDESEIQQQLQTGQRLGHAQRAQIEPDELGTRDALSPSWLRAVQRQPHDRLGHLESEDVDSEPDAVVRRPVWFVNRSERLPHGHQNGGSVGGERSRHVSHGTPVGVPST